MKQTLTIFGLLFCLGAVAQQKDTTVQMNMPINQFRSLLAAIDGNIDSKKASKELVDFLIKSAAILPQKQDSTITQKIKNK